jgi:multidrug efflux pump subunit AcrA (membrane-fusion protein)
MADVTPVRRTSLYFQESGRLTELNAVPGRRVEQGAVLARLDVRDLQHEARLAQIDAETARLVLDNLRLRGALPFDIRLQELALEKQQEMIDYLSARIEGATIRAPYAGVVSSVEVQVGDRVADFATVLEMDDPALLELQMSVDEGDYARIRIGQETRVAAADGSWQPVRIIQLTHRSPAQDATVNHDEYLVHLTLPKKGIDIRENNRVGIQVVVERRQNALVIPLAGLREFQGRTYVRLLEGESRREVDVTVGIRTATQAEIVDGLTEGQLVMVK